MISFHTFNDDERYASFTYSYVRFHMRIGLNVNMIRDDARACATRAIVASLIHELAHMYDYVFTLINDSRVLDQRAYRVQKFAMRIMRMNTHDNAYTRSVTIVSRECNT